MSTKASATVKAVLRDGDQTAIVLVLGDKNTASFEKDERVYIEMTRTTNGDKVDFYPAPPMPKQAEKEDEEELKPVETPAEIVEKPLEVVVETPVIDAPVDNPVIATSQPVDAESQPVPQPEENQAPQPEPQQ